MLNESLITFINISRALLDENKRLKNKLQDQSKRLEYLEDVVDSEERRLEVYIDKIDKLEAEIEEKNLYILELEYDLDKLEAGETELEYIEYLEHELLTNYEEIKKKYE